MSALKLSFFGWPHIERGGTAVTIKRHKAIALLTYLSITQQSFGRNVLAMLLWPDQELREGRAYLRRILHDLKKAVGKEYFHINRQTIAIDQAQTCWVDVNHFRQLLLPCPNHIKQAGNHCQQCQTRQEEALQLYKADFLQGFALSDAPEFENWQAIETQNLQQVYLETGEQLVRYYVQETAWEAALSHARRLVEVDAYYESGHRHLMHIYAQTKRRVAALRQYETCEELLRENLGVNPQMETIALYESILGENRTAPRQFALPQIGQNQRHNLPAELTPFIGREEELKEIEGRFQKPTCRLVTILGPGGMGKTRLALQYARQQIETMIHGAYFVPLAAVQSDEYLITAIADALNFSFYGNKKPKTQLLNYLGQKELLLILDNFEHLLDGASLILEILQEAPYINVLVTSRESLNLQAEWLYEIVGLPYPQKNHKQDVFYFPAMQLFQQHAERVQTGFQAEAAEIEAISQICQFVEGMPLGIELAAALVRYDICREIADEVKTNLDTLSTTMRDIPKRQRSIRAVFESSWQRLSTEEQSAFMKLSVFQGGCQLEAAEYVTGASEELLLALVNKSFLTMAQNGRYQSHELLRQFAIEKHERFLHIQKNIRKIHSDYFASFLQERNTYLRSANFKTTLQGIATDFENIKAAWEWAILNKHEENISKSIETLYTFYTMRSAYQEGNREWAFAIRQLARYQEGSFGKTPKEYQNLIGKLLIQNSGFCMRLGQYEEAKELAQKGLRIIYKHGDWKSEIHAFIVLGVIDAILGNVTEARNLYDHAYQIAVKNNNPRYRALALSNLGILAYRTGNPEKAVSLLQESLKINQEIENVHNVAVDLNNLGTVHKILGNYENAISLYTKSLKLQRSLNNQHGISTALSNLGMMFGKMGNFMKARKYYQVSLEIENQIGHQYGVCQSLLNLGSINISLREHQLAETYLYQTLKMSTKTDSMPQILDALYGYAQLWMALSKKEDSVWLLAAIYSHEGFLHENKIEADTLISQLKSELPSLIFTQNWEKGRNTILEDIITLIFTNEAKIKTQNGFESTST